MRTSSPLLRIAMMIESDGPGGAEMMVLRLSQELRDRGHTVIPIGTSTGYGWLSGHFREALLAPEIFKLRGAIDPKGVRRLARLLQKYEIDVVHSHEFTMAVYGTASSMLLGLPHVITMHGGLKACKALRRRIALRWAMRNSRHTVMVSRATQQQFAGELGVSQKRFTVVPNGVPVRVGNAVNVRKEFGITPTDCVLLAVGTLEVHKGHRVLLEALARATHAGLSAPWKLIIAGGRGGDQHESLLHLARACGLSDRVFIVVNRDDVPDLLAATDVFVIPSLWEGLPMALLEAMVAGKAIIASATAGIPEAIVDGREGILVPPGDVPALSEALQLMLTDPTGRKNFGEAAQLRARREFTAGVMTERYEELYRDARDASRNTFRGPTLPWSLRTRVDDPISVS